jgi:hypothetical protein
MDFLRADWLYNYLTPDGLTLSRASAFWDVGTHSGEGNLDNEEAGNSPPGIEPIAAQSVLPGGSGEVFALVSDLETSPDLLEVTVSTGDPHLIKDLSIEGLGPERRIAFTVSALYSGTGSITVKVSDGESARWIAFPVNIDVELTPFESFMAGYFSDEELLDLGVSSPIADPDGDFIVTLMEFMLGSNPRQYTYPDEVLQVRRVELDGGPAIVISFRRRNDESNIQLIPWMAPESLVYAPMISGGNPVYEENTTVGNNPLYDDVEGTIHIDPAGYDTHFIRMQVELE